MSKTRSILGSLASGRGDTLLDIGANIGWFSLAAAYFGRRVVSVEPGEENMALLRHSLCLAPVEVRERVALVRTGLGAKDGMLCEMWALPNGNRGNMNTVCDSADSSEWMRARNFTKLCEAALSKLDRLVSSGAVSFAKGEKVLIKIDVEGFEPLALAGAEQFLASVRPRRIFGVLPDDGQAGGDERWDVEGRGGESPGEVSGGYKEEGVCGGFDEAGSAA